MQKKCSSDTNCLMQYSTEIFEQFDKVYIVGYVLRELERNKHSQNEEKKYLSRRACRDIEANKDKVIYFVSENKYNLPDCFDKDIIDNRIISNIKELHEKDREIFALSNDILFKFTCESINIPCEKFGAQTNIDVYKGYKELSGDTDFVLNLFDNMSRGKSEYEFLVNEYLILYNTDTKTTSEHKFNGKKFVALKLPDSKVIKGLNSLQRCALDLLNNKDIPIKVVAGGFGSGKTILSVKVGLDLVISKETYNTLMFIRNPVTADGTDIGFLPGSKAEKIHDYCRPFLQYIESPETAFYKNKSKGKNSKEKDDEQFYSEDSYADSLIKQDKIKMDVVSFLKGVSIDDSYVIMDEAEDLNTKLIKLVGSRIGKTSCIVFTGDWKQSENKYKQDNGLVKLIEQGKGNPLVGIVILDEDLRSEASKVFAELD